MRLIRAQMHLNWALTRPKTAEKKVPFLKNFRKKKFFGKVEILCPKHAKSSAKNGLFNRFQKFFLEPTFFRKSKNRKSEIQNHFCVGLSSEIKKWVKMGSFLRWDPLEKRFEGKNSPDFYVANASIFGPFRFKLSEIWHFLFFRKFFEVFGPLLETFQGEQAMFLSRFLAPNTLYQMRPTRGPKSIPTARNGTFYFRKIFEKLKSALSAQIKSKWLENRCSCYIKIRRIFAFQPFFKWGPGKKIDQVEPLLDFRTQPSTLGGWSKNRVGNFFSKVALFLAQKGLKNANFLAEMDFHFGNPLFSKKCVFWTFWNFFEKCVSRGRMRETFRWEQAMFLYRFLALFEERKSWGAMPKLTFSFSHTDPRKTHFFEKIRKDESRLVRKSLFENPKIEISKSSFGCLGWVRLGSKIQKVAQLGRFFFPGPIWKTVGRQKFSWFLCSNCIYFRASTI